MSLSHFMRELAKLPASAHSTFTAKVLLQMYSSKRKSNPDLKMKSLKKKGMNQWLYESADNDCWELVSKKELLDEVFEDTVGERQEASDSESSASSTSDQKNEKPESACPLWRPKVKPRLTVVKRKERPPEERKKDTEPDADRNEVPIGVEKKAHMDPYAPRPFIRVVLYDLHSVESDGLADLGHALDFLYFIGTQEEVKAIATKDRFKDWIAPRRFCPITFKRRLDVDPIHVGPGDAHHVHEDVYIKNFFNIVNMSFHSVASDAIGRFLSTLKVICVSNNPLIVAKEEEMKEKCLALSIQYDAFNLNFTWKQKQL